MPALNEAEISAAREALDDEYRAWTTYDQVIRDFGAVRPFVNIREAEARHITALHALFVRYGLAIRGNSWAGRDPHYGSLYEACAAGTEQRPRMMALLANDGDDQPLQTNNSIPVPWRSTCRNPSGPSVTGVYRPLATFVHLIR
jgi:hypothetical protein